MKSIDNIPELRRLWRLCFDADNAFLDLFFGEGFRLCNSYVLENDNGTVSAMSIFPVQYKGHVGGYIYGVCTDPMHRGHHYASTLMHEVEQFYRQNKAADFLFLRPATHSLFGYYREQGFTYNIYRHRDILSIPMIPAELEIQQLTAKRYHTIRHRFNYTRGMIEWSEDMCSYILSYIRYCQGHAVEINGGESYLLSYPDPENQEIIICEETGVDDTGYTIPLILSTLRILYPNAVKANITLPAYSENKEEYLLCKPLSFSPENFALFSFAME